MRTIKIPKIVKKIELSQTYLKESEILDSGIKKCPLCGSEAIEYDDYIEYGNPEIDGGNDGQYYVRMCSNENCKNYGGF
jgi:hypothetical protein